MTIIDPTNATPGLPRPVQIGVAHYLDADGAPRQAPIYEPSPSTNGERILVELGSVSSSMPKLSAQRDADLAAWDSTS